ncbi:MAG: hypothetical protein ABMB14_17260, partial [Myxococcota bacterium]
MIGWALLAVARPSFAADRVELPPSEAPERWATALSLAGLELVSAQSGGRPTADGAWIRVEITSAGWALRAETADGAVRTARIAVPTTPSDREDVAYLARGLVQS